MTDPKSAVVFEEPPKAQRASPYDWEAIAKKLRRKPGSWAKVFDRDRVTRVTAIRNQDVAALRRDKGFEVRTRNNIRETDESGKEVRYCTLYLRYVKENDKEMTKK